LVLTGMVFMAVVDFTAVVFTAVALMAPALTALPRAAVDDWCNEPIYGGTARCMEANSCC
jgi:hypothetical protein